MSVEQISWAALILALVLFALVFVSSGKADRANKRFLNRVNRGKGNKRK